MSSNIRTLRVPYYHHFPLPNAMAPHMFHQIRGDTNRELKQPDERTEGKDEEGKG
jgi:hypothetical protein